MAHCCFYVNSRQPCVVAHPRNTPSAGNPGIAWASGASRKLDADFVCSLNFPQNSLSCISLLHNTLQNLLKIFSGIPIWFPNFRPFQSPLRVRGFKMGLQIPIMNSISIRPVSLHTLKLPVPPLLIFFVLQVLVITGLKKLLITFLSFSRISRALLGRDV